MITLRPVGVGRTRGCYPCGDMGGRSAGVQGLRGLGKGALGVLSFLGADPPTPEEVAMASSGQTNTEGQNFIERWAAEQRAAGRIPQEISTTALVIGTGVMILGAGLAGYHGYKRSGGKVGSTLGWGFLGGLIPIVTVPVAFAQGYGKRKGR